LTEKLLKEFGQRIGSVKLIPGNGGRFEVSVEAELVFSKKATGRFPEPREISTVVSERLQKQRANQ